MKRNLIIAVGRDGIIGKDNRLPWSYPEDLAYFKRLTLGHPIVMGRKTADSLPRALPERLNLVLTSKPYSSARRREGFLYFSSLEAIEDYIKEHGKKEYFFIGGASLYDHVMEQGLVDELYITRVNCNKVQGNVYVKNKDLKIKPDATRWTMNSNRTIYFNDGRACITFSHFKKKQKGNK